MQIHYMCLKRGLCFVLLFGFYSNFCVAQRGFDLYLTAGMNASQMQGDQLAGFHKPGLHAGLKTGFSLENKWELNLELLYNQKGSRPSLAQSAPNTSQVTQLDYFEIPVYATYNDWYIPEGDYYKVGIHMGLAYAYLFRVKTTSALFGSQENFKEYDVNAFAGFFFAFSPKWSLTVRYSNSFIRIYQDDFAPVPNLINYLWTFRADYHF